MTENQIEVIAALCAMSDLSVIYTISENGIVKHEHLTFQLKENTTRWDIEKFYWNTPFGSCPEVPEVAHSDETEGWIKMLEKEDIKDIQKYFGEIYNVIKWVK